MGSNYFDLLGIAQSYSIDLPALEKAYFAQQRLFHPDRFAGKPTAERMAALQRSADINKAYDALKNPLKRAQYLLHLQGFAVGTEADNVKPSQALLMDVLGWREQAEETADKSRLISELKALHESCIAGIAASYLAKKWDEMAQLTLKLGYVIKTLEETRHATAANP